MGLNLQGPRHRRSAQRVELEGVFVQIGLVPNTEWLKGDGRRCRAAARS